jgi:hypothetical protein
VPLPPNDEGSREADFPSPQHLNHPHQPLRLGGRLDEPVELDPLDGAARFTGAMFDIPKGICGDEVLFYSPVEGPFHATGGIGVRPRI